MLGFTRASGILCPVSAIKGSYDEVGDIGEPARRLLIWLHKAGQKAWMILPLLRMNSDHCPYMGVSGFATEHSNISVEDLADSLRAFGVPFSEPATHPGSLQQKISDVWNLFTAWEAWEAGQLEKSELAKNIAKYEEENSFWLPSYSEFNASEDMVLLMNVTFKMPDQSRAMVAMVPKLPREKCPLGTV